MGGGAWEQGYIYSAYSNLQRQLKLLSVYKLRDLLVVFLRLQFIDLRLASNQGISGGEMGLINR